MLERLLREKLAKQKATSNESSGTASPKQDVAPNSQTATPKQFPMSAGQAGLWHAYCRDPKLTPFNVFLPTRVRSNLNLPALQLAIETIASRHESLRTTFSSQDGQLVQHVHSDLKPEFRVVDLSNIPESQNPEAAARELLHQQMQRPFDLEAGPLLRLFVAKINAEDHVILAATHHIVTDFWSLILTLQELRTVYPQLAGGKALNLPDPSNAFQSFVEEQQQLLQSAKGERLRQHWKHTLAGVAPVVEIPTDYFRPASFSHRAGTTGIELPVGLSQRVKQFATDNRTTPFTVLQAALQVLIQRYSGQEKFFIGTPFSGRTHQRFERTLGFFVNMLPVKADLSGRQSFRDLVSTTSNTLLDCLEHEAYPVADIVHDARLERDPSRSPLFQVSCTFEKAHLKEEVGRGGFLFDGETQSWDFGGLKQESFYMPHQTCHYDLEFIFEEDASQQLRGMLCYCRDLFLPESAQQIVTNYVTLLNQLLEQPTADLSQVTWQPDNATAICNGRIQRAEATRVDELFDKSVSSSPDQLAMVFRDHRVTYEEFGCAAAAIARRLPSPQDGNSQPVPIITGRSPLQWFAQYACHLAGQAFVPVDASQPSIQLDELLGQTEARIVLCDRQAKESAESLNVEALVLEDQLASLADPQAREAAKLDWERRFASGPSGQASDLAYVVYTSGSTGKPKGVMLSHAAAVNTLNWRSVDVPLSPEDRVLIPLSHQFDAGLGLVWTTLSQSATAILATEEHLKDPDSLLDLIIREQVTVLPAPPSLLQLIVHHTRFQECADRLKYVWTGGEAMPPDLPRIIRNRTQARFFNFYGPTEAAIEATFYELVEHDTQRPVPIGKAIHNTSITILDSKGHPLPATVPGEIAIGGAGLAEGYLGAPELTEQKFIDIETASGPERVYLTGDRGRINPAGEIEFLGRQDHQVKLRGYRIELGEIESLLEQDPDVDRSAVVVHRQDSAHATLVGFVSLQAQRVRSEPGLRRSKGAVLKRTLSDALPSYKTPTSILVVDDMPLTTSGKVDRKQLLARVDLAAVEREFVSPTSELEVLLVASWQRHLECEKLSTDINFFDAGGSSLQAAMLTSELGDELGIRIPTSLIFDLATIRQMAIRLAILHPEVVRNKFGDDCLNKHTQGIEAQGEEDSPLHLLARYDVFDQQDSEDTARDTTRAFMIHPPGGIVVCYRELAQHIRAQSDQKLELVGIRSRGLHGAEELPETLESMAAEYVEAVRSLQPVGPYAIGGWSVGGLVAYEVARQLIASGQQVTLTFLDTTIPAQATELVPASETVDVGREYGIDLSLDQLGDLAPEEQLPFLWDHAKKLGVLDDDSDPAVVAQALEDLQNLFHHHIQLATQYEMQPIDAELHLIRPLEMPIEIQVSEDRGWRHLCQGGVHVDFVPGHHHSMVQPPNVEHLASAILKHRQWRKSR